MSKTIDPQLQTMIDHMPKKKGKSLTERYGVISAAALADQASL